MYTYKTTVIIVSSYLASHIIQELKFQQKKKKDQKKHYLACSSCEQLKQSLGHLLSFAPRREMIHCLFSKHPQCIPADETLTSLTTRTLFRGRTRRVCMRTSTDTSPHLCSLPHTVMLFYPPLTPSSVSLSCVQDGTTHCFGSSGR